MSYTLTGWASAEANALLGDAESAVEFLDGGGGLFSSTTLSLMPAPYVVNGQPFNYKQYSVTAVAPAGAVTVRARASMIDAMSNPASGGQAFVVDDFVLVPEPTTLALAGLGLAALVGLRRRGWVAFVIARRRRQTPDQTKPERARLRSGSF